MSFCRIHMKKKLVVTFDEMLIIESKDFFYHIRRR